MDTAIATTAQILSAKVAPKENATEQPTSLHIVRPSDTFGKEWRNMLSSIELTKSETETAVDPSRSNTNPYAAPGANEFAVPPCVELDVAKGDSELTPGLKSPHQESTSAADLSELALQGAPDPALAVCSSPAKIETKASHHPRPEDRKPCGGFKPICSATPNQPVVQGITPNDNDAIGVFSRVTLSNIQPAITTQISTTPSVGVSWTDPSATPRSMQNQVPIPVTATAPGIASAILSGNSSLDEEIVSEGPPETAVSKKAMRSADAACEQASSPSAMTYPHQAAGSAPGLTIHITQQNLPLSFSNAVDVKATASHLEFSGMSEDQRASLAASPKLDVGVFDTAHGWLHIRAELDGRGNITASLTAASTTAHDSLQARLPELANYLVSEQVNVSRLAVHQSTPLAHGLAANTQGQSDGPPAHQQPQHEGRQGSDPERRPPADGLISAIEPNSEQPSKESTREWVGGIARVTAELTWPIGFTGRGHGGWVNVCA